MTRGPGDGALDLRAVRRDDELLDSLGRRGPGDAGDPASLLLAALAVDQEINRFDGVKIEADIWDAIERRRTVR
jgi:hypothetical protein